MKLVLGDDEAVAHWASVKLGVGSFYPPYVAFGVVDDEQILCGAIIFSEFNGFNIEASVAGRATAKRGFLRAALDYAFVQNKCTRLTCRTKRSNKTVCRQLTRLGFKYEGTMKNYFGPDRGDDAILYALFPKDAARWIGEIE